MPNRPLIDDEIKECEALIKKAQDEIHTREQYILSLENEIKNGIYTSTLEQYKAIFDDVAKAVQHDKDIGLQCATGKCNNLIDYTCPDCAEKQRDWNTHGSKTMRK
jgi:hypothetical protein